MIIECENDSKLYQTLVKLIYYCTPNAKSIFEKYIKIYNTIEQNCNLCNSNCGKFQELDQAKNAVIGFCDFETYNQINEKKISKKNYYEFCQERASEVLFKMSPFWISLPKTLKKN
jgi:hypothetical protein